MNFIVCFIYYGTVIGKCWEHNSGVKYVYVGILSVFNWITLSNKDALTEAKAMDECFFLHGFGIDVVYYAQLYL